MSAYLEELTFRLAAGLGYMPEDQRERHAQFVLAHMNEDGAFRARDGSSDLYYTGFALRSLAMLGAMTEEIAARTGNYLQQRLVSQAPIIDFLSLIYGAMLLKMTADVDIFAAAADDWPQKVQAALERYRRPDGGYAQSDEGHSSSTYNSFLVSLCYELIGVPLVEPEKLENFVWSRQRDDGGFVEIGPMKRSGTNPTAAAVGLLKVLGKIDDDLRTDVGDYMAEMQGDEGGFMANTRILAADVLSTFTALLTLADLDALDQIDAARALRFVQSMAQPGGGYLGGAWDEAPDVEYTFYGLGGSALLLAHMKAE